MKRKQWFSGMIAATLVFLLGWGLVAAPVAYSQKDTVHIRFSTWHVPAGADVQRLWTPMLEEMKKRSDGRITYSMFAGGALGKGPDHFDIVRTGLADMGYATLTWTPGRFPLSDVLSAPISSPAKWKGAEAGMGMYERMLKSEFEDVQVIHINNCVMAHLWTNKPVRKLEDMRGLKIRSPGGLQTRAIEALGATPVFLPLGDVYLSIETGVIDGVVTCPALIKAFKLDEVAKFGVPVTFGCVAEGVFANKRFWERVPEDLKPIIAEVGRDAYKIAGLFDEAWYDQVMGEIGETVDLYHLPSEENARWNDALKGMLVTWAEELEAKGLPAKEALIAFREELAKVDVAFEACPY